jgi:hypothetical protein
VSRIRVRVNEARINEQNVTNCDKYDRLSQVVETYCRCSSITNSLSHKAAFTVFYVVWIPHVFCRDLVNAPNPSQHAAAGVHEEYLTGTRRSFVQISFRFRNGLSLLMLDT